MIVIEMGLHLIERNSGHSSINFFLFAVWGRQFKLLHSLQGCLMLD